MSESATVDESAPADLLDEIGAIGAAAVARTGEAGTLDDLRAVESELLGRKSPLAQLNARLRTLPPDQRKLVGQAINEARNRVAHHLAARQAELEATDRSRRSRPTGST